jgi:hypothetical protein
MMGDVGAKVLVCLAEVGTLRQNIPTSRYNL